MIHRCDNWLRERVLLAHIGVGRSFGDQFCCQWIGEIDRWISAHFVSMLTRSKENMILILHGWAGCMDDVSCIKNGESHHHLWCTMGSDFFIFYAQKPLKLLWIVAAFLINFSIQLWSQKYHSHCTLTLQKVFISKGGWQWMTEFWECVCLSSIRTSTRNAPKLTNWTPCWMKLNNKLKQTKAGIAVVKEKEKGNQANTLTWLVERSAQSIQPLTILVLWGQQQRRLPRNTSDGIIDGASRIVGHSGCKILPITHVTMQISPLPICGPMRVKWAYLHIT